MTRPSASQRPDARLRSELVALLRGGNAHVPTLDALKDVPADAVHQRPQGFVHSLGDVLYHLWFTQRDILEFCRRADYAEPHWPDAYWPTPGAAVDWDRTLDAFSADLREAVRLARTADLFAELDHAPGYTALRELLLVADHNAHHMGQVITLRRSLEIWPPGAAPSTPAPT